ncbi:hypothetical protein ACX93W_18835 [Paenibacillus sp. CAU 1782]
MSSTAHLAFAFSIAKIDDPPINDSLVFFPDFIVALRNMPFRAKKFSSRLLLYRQFTAAIRQSIGGWPAVFVGSLDNGGKREESPKPLWALVYACGDKTCAAVHFVGKNFWAVYDN